MIPLKGSLPARNASTHSSFAALKLRGVRITGVLDLAGGTIGPYVELQGCRFDGEVVLPEARFGTLRMIECALPRLEAARLHTEGDLHLPRCRVDRGIRLTDAQIGTDLLVNQIRVWPDRRGRAITADGMVVAQDLQAELIETHGELSLRGAKIGVLLRGTKREDVERGQVLCKPGSITPHTKFLAEAYILTKEEGGRHTPFFTNYRPQFYFRTTDVTGIVHLKEGVEMIMPGDNAELNVELITPIAMDQGLRFAIREGGRTVGAGVVAKIVE